MSVERSGSLQKEETKYLLGLLEHEKSMLYVRYHTSKINVKDFNKCKKLIESSKKLLDIL